MRLNLRLKIIEHFRTNENFANALRESGLKIDVTVISRIINCRRKPTGDQRRAFVEFLKTGEKKLFEVVDGNN